MSNPQAYDEGWDDCKEHWKPRIEAMDRRIKELEAERDAHRETILDITRERDKWRDSYKELEAENKRLRQYLQYFYDYGYDRLKCEKALEE